MKKLEKFVNELLENKKPESYLINFHYSITISKNIGELGLSRIIEYTKQCENFTYPGIEAACG